MTAGFCSTRRQSSSALGLAWFGGLLFSFDAAGELVGAQEGSDYI
jgi:hypothetical protein